MPLRQWLHNFQSKRGINNADGRPLFAYKASSDEFESLRLLLQQFPEINKPYYPKAWLLFAAEWWKREYPGGAWRWGPLCQAAGLHGLPYIQIRNLVIEGCRLWGLNDVINNEGKRFIGLVAVNGGLPMRLVETAQGKLSYLLRMVIQQALDYNLQNVQLRQAIEAQAKLLPASYRQAPVYELLEGLINALLHIRQEFALQDAQDPIACLQEQCPHWENFFPITLDTQAAASLIKGLVRDTFKIAPGLLRPPFQIQRGLRFSSDGAMPVFELSFSLQARSTRIRVAEALGIAGEMLPPHFQLLLRTGDREYMVGEALLRGEEYQFIAKALPTINNLYEGAQLIVSRWGATLYLANLPGGEALSLQEPLIFENTYPFARLLAQGDALVKGDSALAVVPPKTIFFAENGDTRELHCLADGQILLELPSGVTRFTYNKQSFIVTVNNNAPPTLEAYWQGSRLDAISEPSLVFRGKPNLRIEQNAGIGQNAPQHELFVRFQGQELPLNQVNAPGLCRLIWRTADQRRVNTRAILLPSNASITYIPGETPFEGTISLNHWPEIPVRCESEHINLTSRHDGRTLILDLQSSAAQPSTSVQLCLQWPDGEQKLILPFPGYGVTLLRNNTRLNATQRLTVEELIGCRAVLMSGQGPASWQIRLRSFDSATRSELFKEIPYIGIREIRLFELIPEIQRMLSCHANLDHRVTLEFVHMHQVQTQLQIGRYSTCIRFDNQFSRVALTDGSRDLLLDQHQAEGLILSLPLAEPEHEPVSLPLQFSEQVYTGNWLINLPAGVAGPWLLYTKANSPLNCRPTVVPNVNNAENLRSSLGAAICVGNRAERLSQIRSALRAIATTPEAEDWKTVELLLDELHHLPLASLDLCQALICEPQALTMATLLLDDFACRLAESLPSEMPFEWLLISQNHWFNTFGSLRNQIPDNNPRLLSMIRNDIQNKSQYLARWQPALNFIFEQGLHRYFNLVSPNVQLFLNNPEIVISLWQVDLFEGENSKMQQMFRRNPADIYRYPNRGNGEIDAFLQTPTGQQILQLSNLQPNDMRLPVVMLPFIVAVDTYSNQGHLWQTDPVRLWSLRNARHFDTIWFDLAYELGLVMAQADLMQV